MWAREDDFDSIIAAWVASFNWPVDGAQVTALVKAIIGQESAYNPAAVRQEPGGDASIGLMQVLFSTAQSLGYPGEIGDPTQLTGLYDPSTNLYVGIKLVWTLMDQLGASFPSVASAYNGGIRQSIGMGAPVTKATTVCLARNTAGDCIKTFTAQPGQYGNQPYVDAVMKNFDYFSPDDSSVPGAGGPPAPPLSLGEVGSSPLVWVLGGSLLLLGFLATR